MTSYVSGKALVKDFPQIEKAVYVASAGAVIMQNGQPSLADDFNFVDGDFFDVLQLPVRPRRPRSGARRPQFAGADRDGGEASVSPTRMRSARP